MNTDRRKRLDEISALLVTASDLLGLWDKLPKNENGHRVTEGYHGYENGVAVRVLLGVAQQRLTAVHDEEKAASASSPVGLRYRFEFEDDSLTRASSLLVEAIGSYPGRDNGVRSRKLMEEACNEIHAAK